MRLRLAKKIGQAPARYRDHHRDAALRRLLRTGDLDLVVGAAVRIHDARSPLLWLPGSTNPEAAFRRVLQAWSAAWGGEE